MQKKIVFSLAAVLVATSANAGWFDFLGFGQKAAEPTTLAEACNKDEVSKFCPEILTGEKTIPTCLIDNVKSLSKKCANFVKKSIQEQAAELTGAATATGDEATDAANAKVAEAQAQVAEAKATAEEVKAAAKQVEADAKETGSLFKNMFKPSAE
jgi:hypothetical protein